MKHQELVNTASLNWTTHLHPYSGQKQVVRARRASEPLEWSGGEEELRLLQCSHAALQRSFLPLKMLILYPFSQSWFYPQNVEESLVPDNFLIHLWYIIKKLMG